VPWSLERADALPVPAEVVRSWLGRPPARLRLVPPWAFRLEGETLVGWGPLRGRWRIGFAPLEGGCRVEAPHGPWAPWSLERRVLPEGPDACRVVDRLEAQAPPPERTARWAEEALAWARRRMAHDLRAHLPCLTRGTALPVAVTGASGFIGSALVAYLEAGGHRVLRLVRRRDALGPGSAFWDPEAGHLDPQALEGVEAVVHLAGENIAGLWTGAKRRRILESRVRSTRLLASTLARMERPPRALVCASAVGIYGDRGDEPLTEESPPAQGFLPEVVQAWETAAEPARRAGVRTVFVRFGVVLDPSGGALARLLPVLRLGLGAVFGSGRQYFPWLTLDDALDILHRALLDEGLEGPVNACAPGETTQEAFLRAVAQALRRPLLLRAPAPLLRLALGRMAQEALLPSQRVRPARLTALGHPFRHPDLATALRDLLGPPP